MAAQKEIPIDDAELDALMAELDAETSDMVSVPVGATAPASAPSAELPDADLDGLDDIESEQLRDQANAEGATAITSVASELTKRGELSANDAVALAQAEQSKISDEDELAALQAELDANQSKPAPATKPEATHRFGEGKSSPAETIAANKDGTPATAAATSAPDLSEPAHPNPEPVKKQPKLQFYLDVEQFKTDIAVSEHNLDNAMMQQAGLFAWHAAESARAEAQHARVKLRFDVVEAKLYDRHRKALALTGEKVTEKMVENAVKMDPEYLQAKNLVIESEMLASFNKGAVEALRHRKDMIVQLGADRREEYKGQVRTMDATHADVKARALAVAA